MKILKDLNQSERNALKETHLQHHLFGTHIERVIDMSHCYIASIFASDYDEILIFSCFQNPVYPLQPISETIRDIKANPDFLKYTTSGCLSGTMVQNYINTLIVHQPKLKECFSALGTCFLLDKSEQGNPAQNEITDGMHRLTAYGLATDLKESYFPIQIHYGTNKNLETSKTD